MSTDISHTIRIQFWGKYACFTRPEMKVERVSYPMMTPRQREDRWKVFFGNRDGMAHRAH